MIIRSLHHAFPELSLKRDRVLAKANAKSPLSPSPCNSCAISASCQRDFGDFCRARQKLLAKRVCAANRAKQILSLADFAQQNRAFNQTLASARENCRASRARPLFKTTLASARPTPTPTSYFILP